MEEFSRRYRILARLAEGSSGVIYRAQDLAHTREVAIKILKGELLQDEESRERLRREALATNLLEHPSVVKIFAQGQLHNGNPWLAMELLQGITLEEKLERDGPLSQDEFVAILRPVCALLAEAHSKGILHRDLKAHHIILPGDPRIVLPRVIDFGLAFLRGADTLTKSDVMAGDPQYMAPEQWDGLHKADARSDIYSMGMIAYQCLAGRLPFEASSLFDWMRMHFHETPQEISQAMKGRALSPSLASAVMRAITKRPEDRQQSMEELMRALFGLAPAR